MNEADAPTGVPIGPPSRLMQSESISLFPTITSDLAVTLSADDTAAAPATLANGAAGVTSCHKGHLLYDDRADEAPEVPQTAPRHWRT